MLPKLPSLPRSSRGEAWWFAGLGLHLADGLLLMEAQIHGELPAGSAAEWMARHVLLHVLLRLGALIGLYAVALGLTRPWRRWAVAAITFHHGALIFLALHAWGRYSR